MGRVISRRNLKQVMIGKGDGYGECGLRPTQARGINMALDLWS